MYNGVLQPNIIFIIDVIIALPKLHNVAKKSLEILYESYSQLKNT